MTVADRIKDLLQKKRLKTALILLGSLVAATALVLLADYAFYYSRTYPRVMLEMIAVGSMSMEEVNAHLEGTIWSTEIIHLSIPDSGDLSLSLSELGLSWDKSETLERIYRAARGWSGYRVRLNSMFYKQPIVVAGVFHVDENRFARVMAELAEQVYRPPRDASFEVERETVTIVVEKDGRYLKVGELREAILDGLYVKSPRVPVPVGDWPAARTASDLESYDLQQVMAAFYTDVAGGNPDRAHNIMLGAAAINGFLMAPGDVFSFNDTVGQTTREKGYRYAPIIVGDELVPGLGGGLCQVSTTLYNAALYANLEIIERHNHSMPIAYIPLGRDATIAIGTLDLKIMNNRDHYILIGTDLTNLRLTFRIFGPPMEEKVDIISSGYQQVAPPVRYEYTDALPAGVTEIAKPGKPGTYITTWRVVYLNDQEKSREMLARDYYTPTATVYRVGTGD